MTPGFTVGLRLHSGVPVVEVQGEWGPAATETLYEMIRALTSAGHFDIIVNLQRAASDWLSTLTSISPLAQTVRSHHGHIEIVGTAEQVAKIPSQHRNGLFRLATSETGALSHIKRVPVYSSGPNCTARVGIGQR